MFKLESHILPSKGKAHHHMIKLGVFSSIADYLFLNMTFPPRLFFRAQTGSDFIDTGGFICCHKHGGHIGPRWNLNPLQNFGKLTEGEMCQTS